MSTMYTEEPVRSWLVRDARARFSDVIDAALGGQPQRVTRRGKGAVVVVSEEEWRRLSPAGPRTSMTLGEYLATFPETGIDIDLVAARRRGRPNPFADWDDEPGEA